MTRKLRTDRLLLVADTLRTLQPAQFAMAHIAESPAPQFTCETSACVAGWAGTIPALCEQGYAIEWSLSLTGRWFGCPTYQGREYEEALARFFGMTDRGVDSLFYSGFNMTAKEKAAEIEELCRTYEERRACA